MSKYRAVLIVGLNNPLTDDIRSLYKGEDCLIIGDGINPITAEEVTIGLNGKVAADTRFDIWGHGMIDGTQSHRCQIFTHEADKTSDILNFIAEEIDSPIETHLWSCFGGAAAKDVKELPEGSCVIAHAPQNAPTTLLANKMGIVAGVRKHLEYPKSTEHKLNYQHVLDNLGLGGGQNMFIGINQGDDKEPVIVKDRLAQALTALPTIALPNAQTLSNSLDWNYSLLYETISTTDLNSIKDISLPTRSMKLEHSLEEMQNLCTGVMAMMIDKIPPQAFVAYTSVNPAFHQFHKEAIKQTAPLIVYRAFVAPPHGLTAQTAAGLVHNGAKLDAKMQSAFTPNANMRHSIFEYAVIHGYQNPAFNTPAISIMLNASPTKTNMHCIYHHALAKHVLAYAATNSPALVTHMMAYEAEILSNVTTSPPEKIGPVFIRNLDNARITEQFLSHPEKISDSFIGIALVNTPIDTPHFPFIMKHVHKASADCVNTFIQHKLYDETKYTTELLKLGDALTKNSLNILLNNITEPEEQLPLLFKQAYKMNLGHDAPGLLYDMAQNAHDTNDPSKIINVLLNNTRYIPVHDLDQIISNSFTAENKEILVTALREHREEINNDSLGKLMLACIKKPEYLEHIIKAGERIPLPYLSDAIEEIYAAPEGFHAIITQAERMSSDELETMLYFADTEHKASAVLKHIDRITDRAIGNEIINSSHTNLALDTYFAHSERIPQEAMNTAVEMACKNNNTTFFKKMIAPTSTVSKDTISMALEIAAREEVMGVNTTDIQLTLATRLSSFDVVPEKSWVDTAAPDRADISVRPVTTRRMSTRVSAVGSIRDARAEPLSPSAMGAIKLSSKKKNSAKQSHQEKLLAKRNAKSSKRTR